ncbi:CsbD family protein [Streptomyces rubellomurinus]|uniref:General stress protein CsbD n=2 Tax=Streptomyces TaxID=1883 RepID=A0A0F2TGU5_STRR3|nr:CsbD family protein [Streptomyces rubellomurinus]KJS61455.1 general stress protein CsbD [Streptomyces rubellomurinus]
MGAGKKIAHAAETAKGKVKEAAGKAVGNERLAAKGKGEQVKGDLSQAGQKAKDAFKH